MLAGGPWALHVGLFSMEAPQARMSFFVYFGKYIESSIYGSDAPKMHNSSFPLLIFLEDHKRT
jgi:hypothetical protein